MHWSSEALRANPDVRLGAGGAAASHGEHRRAARRLFSHRAGAVSMPAASAMPSACLRPLSPPGRALFNLFTPQVTVTLRARCVRRQPPSGGIAGRAGRGEPLPARRHVSDPHRERGDDGNPGGRLAGPNRGHRASDRARARSRWRCCAANWSWARLPRATCSLRMRRWPNWKARCRRCSSSCSTRAIRWPC